MSTMEKLQVDLKSVEIFQDGSVQRFEIDESHLIIKREMQNSALTFEVTLRTDCGLGRTVLLKESRVGPNSDSGSLTELEFYMKMSELQGRCIPRVHKASWYYDGKSFDGMALEHSGIPIQFDKLGSPDHPVIRELRRHLLKISEKGIVHYDEVCENFLYKDEGSSFRVTVIDFSASCMERDLGSKAAIVNACSLSTILRRAGLIVEHDDFRSLSGCKKWLSAV